MLRRIEAFSSFGSNRGFFDGWLIVFSINRGLWRAVRLVEGSRGLLLLEACRGETRRVEVI